MVTDCPAATVATVAIVPAALPHSVRQRIFFYLGVLIVLLAFGAPGGGLIDIPISFFLKNKLHLKAHEVAEFRLVSAIPLYLSFVFGFIRDMWNPFGMRDRGFMLLFGAISAGLYVLFAFTPISYVTLLVAIVQTMVVFFAQRVLDEVVSEASRTIQTGQAQTSSLTQSACPWSPRHRCRSTQSRRSTTRSSLWGREPGGL